MVPYLGWAQERDQIAPSCLRGGVSEGVRRGMRIEEEEMEEEAVDGWAYPFNVSVSLCVSPSISNILIVRSEEQVARRRP